jgi:hypothetical protein
MRPPKPPPVRYRSDGDRNHRTTIVECALQHSLCRNSNLSEDLPERLDSSCPLPLDAATEIQGQYVTHWVNLADTLLRDLTDELSTNFTFARR